MEISKLSPEFPCRRNFHDLMRVEALFDASAAYYLRETKLSEDRTMKERPDGRVLVKATARDTGALRLWLLGFWMGWWSPSHLDFLGESIQTGPKVTRYAGQCIDASANR